MPNNRWRVGSVKGLCVDRRKSGNTGYCYRYTSKQNTRHLLSLGDCDEITLEQAEEKAKELKAKIKAGYNPVFQNNLERENKIKTKRLKEIGSGFTGSFGQHAKIFDFPLHQYEVDYLKQRLKPYDEAIAKQLLSRLAEIQ